MTALFRSAQPVANLTKRGRWLPWLFAAGFGLVAQVTQAAGLQVSPILLEFAAGDAAQGIWLSNSGDAPLRAQVRVQQWTQNNGVEQLQPTRDLVASPPVMEIAPGERQMVRVVRLQTGAPAQEQAYRLLLDELPSDSQALGAAATTGLQFLLRHSVPMFVVPQGAKPLGGRAGTTDTGPLSAQAAPASDGVQLAVRNTGVQRVRLSQLAFVDAKNQPTPLVPGLLGYVLAGQNMQWSLRLTPEQLRNGGYFKARLNDDLEPQALPQLPSPQ